MSEELFDIKNWLPNSQIIQYLEKNVPESKEFEILEMTDSHIQKIFPLSTRQINWFNIPKDIYEDSYLFTFIRHSLEKMQNPHEFLDCLRKKSLKGYIETSSPIVEILRRIQNVNLKHRGHLLNRYIIWTESDTNILHILPKYSFIEHILISENFENEMRILLKKYPHYWNTYYTWDIERPIQYIIYQHGVNFFLERDYHTLIIKAIQESIKSSNKFLSHINNNDNIFKDI